MQTSYQQISDKALPGLIGQAFGTENIRSFSNKNFVANVWSYTVASDAETTTIVTLPDANATQITVTTAAQGSAALTADKHVDDLKASLIFVRNIEGKDAIVRSVGASGILRKAQQKYLKEAS